MSRVRTEANAAELLGFIGELEAAGAKIVWTKHNPAPHDPALRDVDATVTRRMLALADRVVVLGRAARRVLESQVEPNRLAVLPHPSLAGCYGPPVPREQARAQLNLPADRFIFGSLGEIRPYKHLEFIADAFRAAATRNGRRPILLIAGKPGPRAYLDAVKALASDQVRVHPREIPDADMATWLGAMDAAVFAFRDIWGSSSVVLALSYGVPAVAPDIGCLGEYVREQDTGFLYNHGVPDSLANAMHAAIASPLGPHLRYMCAKFNRTHAPARIAEQTAALYRTLGAR